MIFCAKNEAGVPHWQLILEGKKTVTRRMKPMKVGKSYAVQKAYTASIGRIRCIGVMPHLEWYEDIIKYDLPVREEKFKEEVRREGFVTWAGLEAYFSDRRKSIFDTYRNVFELVDICPGCVNHNKQPSGCTWELWAREWWGTEGVRSCGEFNIEEVL